MAPRTDFHRFWIDFSMILEWISQVYFDRYCDEVESEFGFVLPRGRKDAKLRSSEGMKARSRAQNGIRSHVRGSCSKSLCSLTLHSVAHRSALPCSVHGYARVHTSIYIYIYTGGSRAKGRSGAFHVPSWVPSRLQSAGAARALKMAVRPCPGAASALKKAARAA